MQTFAEAVKGAKITTVQELREEAKLKMPIAAIAHSNIRILLAGLDTPENNYTRAIEGYGFEVVKYDGYGKANFDTDCAAAIIVISHLSHGDFYNVKDTYRNLGRRVFISKGGFSMIKTDFEYHFFEDFREKLERLDTNSRLQFLFCYLFRERGNTIDYQDFTNRVRRLFPQTTELEIKNFQTNMAPNGSLESVRKGTWKFNGITERVYNKLVEMGLPMTTDWLMLKKDETPIKVIMPTQPINPTPTPEPAPVAAPQSESLGVKEELNLVTSTVSEMEKRLNEMHAMLQLKTLDRPTTEKLIAKRLSEFSDAKLLSLWDLIRP